jgi:Calpain family cysteine protease
MSRMSLFLASEATHHMGSLSTPPQAAILANSGIEADVAKDLQNGSLSYSADLSILEDAAVGGMTASKFSTLQTFASELNTAGGISVSPYVQQITDDVIFGNSANATWNGGAATATALGNLKAASTQTQADDLIGEWFLGANLPSLNLAPVGQENLNPTYKASTLPLYGPSGSPTYQDVNQGYLGDCYFLSSLGEIALKDPSAIENMISANGNGTYSVRFFVNGQPDYVTVNSELPVMSGYEWANGSQLEFANGRTDDWVALVEKAYAQLNAQTNAPHGMELNSASDSYAGITAGNGSALTLVTDQPETATSLYPNESTSALGSILTNLASSFSAGEEVLMSTPWNSGGNLVADHMYMVTGVNATTGALTIHNPWNTAYSGSLSMSFTETIQQLAANNCTLWVTSGHPVA